MKRALLVLVTSAAVLPACAMSSDDGWTVTHLAPGPSSFSAVARTLDAHCGMLDCHGSEYRNLRLFGWSGRRYAPTDLPGGAPTTPVEVGLAYCAITGLEPEALERMTAERETGPEALTLVQKARGVERHAGGVVFAAGGPGDTCLLTWLEGRTDAPMESCERSLNDLGTKPPVVLPDVDLSGCNSGSRSIR